MNAARDGAAGVVRIEQLSLRLPHFLRDHATLVARELGAALARSDLQLTGQIEHLRVPAIKLRAGTGPEAAARAIAEQVARDIARRPR